MPRPVLRFAGASCLLAVATAWSAPAAAVEPLDTFSARLGGFVSRFDTRMRVDGENQPGTEIDLHRDLALDTDDALGFAGVTWRPFDRHEFAFTYFRDGAGAERQLERDITFNGTVYEAEATVHADYDLDVYEMSYTWWGVSREDWALGPRLGLVWYQLELGLRMTLDVDGNPVGEGERTRRVSADLPAPSVGVGWRWTPAEDWRLLAELGYFSASLGDVDGDVIYGRAGVEWHPWARAGLMLEYTVSDIDLDVDKRRFDGSADFRNSGLRLGVVFRY